MYFDKVLDSANFTLSNGQCVEQCPKTKNDAVKCYDAVTGPYCLIKNPVYATINVLNYCIPSEISDEFRNALSNQSGGFGFMYDFNLASTAIYTCIGMSLVFNVVFIYFMSYYPETLAKITVVLIHIIFVGGAGASAYFGMKSSNGTPLYVSAGVSLFFVMMFDCMLCYRYKHFKVAIAVIDAAADFFASTKRLMFVSVFYGILGFVVILACIAGCLCVFTLNDFDIVQDNGGSQGFVRQINFNSNT